MSADDWRRLATPATYRPEAEPSAPRALMSPGDVLVLPYPPALNAMQRIFTPPRKCPHCHKGLTPKDLAGARIVLTSEARDYKETIAQLVRASPLAGPIEVLLKVFRPRKAGDLDGRLKVLLDSLQGIVYGNDSQVEHIDAWRFDDKENPRAEVEVRPLDVAQRRLL